MPVIVRFMRFKHRSLKCPPGTRKHGSLIDNGAIKLIDVRVCLSLFSFCSTPFVQFDSFSETIHTLCYSLWQTRNRLIFISSSTHATIFFNILPLQFSILNQPSFIEINLAILIHIFLGELISFGIFGW